MTAPEEGVKATGRCEPCRTGASSDHCARFRPHHPPQSGAEPRKEGAAGDDEAAAIRRRNGQIRPLPFSFFLPPPPCACFDSSSIPSPLSLSRGLGSSSSSFIGRINFFLSPVVERGGSCSKSRRRGGGEAAP